MAFAGGEAEDGNVKRVPGFVVAVLAGLGIWMATMATVPDGAYVSSARTMLLWVAMIVAAAALGYALPGDGELIALGLVGGPLLTAGWTAPRGDEDGLWVLFFPYLVFMGFVLLLIAWLAGRLRTWLVARPEQDIE
jgi:hypothetical protein